MAARCSYDSTFVRTCQIEHAFDLRSVQLKEPRQRSREFIDSEEEVRQGREPFTLQGGATEAQPSALPIQTLLPLLDEERPRFGQASLGAWSESEEVLRRIQSQQRLAAMRPWLLWAVLLAGVTGLGFMVWRLARGSTRP